MWMTPYLSQTKKYKCSILITFLRNGNFLNQCYGVSPISVFPTLSVILMLLNGWVIEKNMLSIKARNKQTTSFSIKTLAQTLIRLIRLNTVNQVFSRNITHSVTGLNSWDVQHIKWPITLKLNDGPQKKPYY